MIRQVHRWLPDRTLVTIGDGSYAVVALLANVVRLPHVSMVTRLRLDAALYASAPKREAGKKGRPAVKGPHQPTLAKRLADFTTVWEKRTVSWYGHYPNRRDRNGPCPMVSSGHSSSGHPLGAGS